MRQAMWPLKACATAFQPSWAHLLQLPQPCLLLLKVLPLGAQPTPPLVPVRVQVVTPGGALGTAGGCQGWGLLRAPQAWVSVSTTDTCGPSCVKALEDTTCRGPRRSYLVL